MGAKSAVMQAQGELKEKSNKKDIGRFGAKHFFKHFFHRAKADDVLENLKARVEALGEKAEQMWSSSGSSEKEHKKIKGLHASAADCCVYIASLSSGKNAAEYHEKAGHQFRLAKNYGSAAEQDKLAIIIFDSIGDKESAERVRSLSKIDGDRLREKGYSHGKPHAK
jgi:hypothetical protein